MPQFRAKARAVELLGKGQISDLPTAITELWKNGYDAYAGTLEAHLYLPGYEQLKTPLFVVSDDGIGMSREDILTRWIVLGTDSKSRDTVDNPGPNTLNKLARIKMGEKGIGRLSVAYLGSPMLMLTKRLDGVLQAVFFDWRILENYNLFLEDINIPLRSYSEGDSFIQIFSELRTEFLENFTGKKREELWLEQTDLKNSIIDSCEKISLGQFFQYEVLDPLIGNSKAGHGTKFVIFEPEQQLLSFQASVIDREDQDDMDQLTLDYFRSSLAGLFNVFKPEDSICSTHIWIVNEAGRYDFLDKREFFTSSDFEISDHVIDGKFDQSGRFDGTVRIYDKIIPHHFEPHRPRGSLISYGPFDLKLGYEEGNIETHLLSGENRKLFENKLQLFGGLYIYRDDFRVLPYGRRDQDFLEFEEKRSRGAGYYFFSHRRMFGYLSISRRQNAQLRDKAGREGFINNTAYRDFKRDLQAFFDDLAKRYFGTNATSDIKREQKDAMREFEQTARIEKEKEKIERKAFTEKLKTLPSELTDIENTIASLSDELSRKLQQTDIIYDEIEGVLRRIDTQKIRLKSLNITYPIRYKPTENQRKRIYELEKRLEHVQTIAIADSDNVTRLAVNRLKERELLQEFTNRSKQYTSAIADTFAEREDRFDVAFRTLKDALIVERKKVSDTFQMQIQALVPTHGVLVEVDQALQLLENSFQANRDAIRHRLDPFIDHLSKLTLDIDEDQLVGYYKLKYEEIEEEWERTRELAQLGIAVEIIDHEFNVLYSQLANTVKIIGHDLRDEAEARRHYDQLTHAFEHLESNYKLLQPLYRTTGRIRRPIKGQELFDYVSRFFEGRLRDQRISLEITSSASALTFFTYDSIVKPVIINIINNALYWLRPVEDRRIRFDARDNQLLIQNSGVPIEGYLLEDIFKLFYSKRPNGRGIGLYLAYTSMKSVGLSLYATNEPSLNTLKGACFVIQPMNQ